MERKTIARPALMHVARLGFVLVSMFLGATITAGYNSPWWNGSLLGALFAACVVGIELGLRDVSFRRFSHATVGLLFGLTGAWLVTNIGFFRAPGLAEYQEARSIFELVAFLGLGFLGMMLALRANREEFSLLIPYVRFRQEAARDQPVVAGTDIFVDGRLPKLFGTGFLSGALHVPRFVIEELRDLTESPHEVRAERGRRGLECLEQMRLSARIELVVQEPSGPADQAPDRKLIALARDLGARLLTVDAELQRAARLQGVAALNLEDLWQALRPLWKPGDEIALPLVKEGKDADQAVGYLPDGTMIVVNDARGKVGSTQPVIISGFVKTSAGKLLFAELKGSARARPFEVISG